MSGRAANDWVEANQRYLMAELARVRALLEQRAGSPDATPVSDHDREVWTALQGMADADASTLPPPALDTLCALFDLSPFERSVLLLCAGAELDSSFASLCAAAQGDPRRTHPTFSLALAALPEPHWSALSPERPLRYWRLIEVGSNDGLAVSPLRIDERILNYVTGVQHLDGRLAGFVEPVLPPDDLVESHHWLAERLTGIWAQVTDGTRAPVVQLCGKEDASQRAITAAACAMAGFRLCVMPAHVIPLDPREREALIRLWEREAGLSASALLVECGQIEASDTGRESAVTRLIESTGGLVIISSRERRLSSHRSLITLEVDRPTAAEQRALWRTELGASAIGLDGRVDGLVAQFSLSAPTIRAVCAQALGDATTPEEGRSEATTELGAVLWEACRVQARPRLEDLAQRIESVATWDDLVLPEAQARVLQEIAIHVRQRTRVYETWGFAAKSSRGLGISALFAGSSGTGKTMAAEVLANELQLDLYRIDLSQVVSKYIGETEKNLRRVFDAAEEGGAILLFDEADALFGKRSEVKDSHDRYANIEVSYLLQRMEAYRGLAILTSNMKSALDSAFLRRIRFVVQFPFPDAAARSQIWQRIFPVDTPTDGLDMGKLARLDVPGGTIRNVALYAAFLAAEAEEPVRMAHLLRAARVEYAKLERPLTEAEIGGWV